MVIEEKLPKVFARLKIEGWARRAISPQEKQNRAKYQEEYWALRRRFNVKDGVTLEPLQGDQKKKFREEVKKLKKTYHIGKN